MKQVSISRIGGTINGLDHETTDKPIETWVRLPPSPLIGSMEGTVMIYVVFKKKWKSGQYGDITVDANVLLITDNKEKCDQLIRAAELLDCEDDIFVCERELE